MTNLLNQNTLDELRSLGDDFFQEMIELFLESSQNQMELIRQGVTEQNGSNIESAAHSLKGACYGQGAKELSELCAEMEKDGREGNLSGTEELMSRLEKSLSLTAAELKKLL